MADEMVAKFKRTQLHSIHYAREGGDEYDEDTDRFTFFVTLTVQIDEAISKLVLLDTERRNPSLEIVPFSLA